jgi:hypothetical protein
MWRGVVDCRFPTFRDNLSVPSLGWSHSMTRTFRGVSVSSSRSRQSNKTARISKRNRCFTETSTSLLCKDSSTLRRKPKISSEDSVCFQARYHVYITCITLEMLKEFFKRICNQALPTLLVFWTQYEYYFLTCKHSRWNISPYYSFRTR